MRVTLVYAGITSVGFNGLFQGMEGGWISHGLCILGACAKQEGFEVDLIDLRALKGWDDFRAQVVARRPAVIGFYMPSVNYNPVVKGIKIVKEVDPNIITMVGGPHPTAVPEEVMAEQSIDYVVTGEGEIVFVDFLKNLRNGIRPTERLLHGMHPDPDAQPIADRDLFLDEWKRAGFTPESPEVSFCDELPIPFVTIIAGRGCHYNCNFCKPVEDLIFGGKTRRRSVAHVIGELKYLRDRFHFKSFMIHDDCLTENREWVKGFCRAYKAEGFTQPFFCQSRADLVVKFEDMIKLMVNVGLKGLFIGFESGSDRVLKFIRKGTTRATNIAAADICKKYGITVWANYMLALPTETEDEIRETISMMKRIDPDYYSPAFFTPYPGSDLHAYCVEHDLSLIHDHDSYRRNPTEPKIKGHDYKFLQWAVQESQRRTLPNAINRRSRYFWKRYASPKKVVRRLGRMMGAGT